MFWEQVARVILGIPLSRLGRADRMFWGLLYIGIFSVKRAYHLALEQASVGLGKGLKKGGKKSD